MVLTLGAIALLAGAGLLGNLIGTAADEAHSKAAREDTQAFNAEEAIKQRQFEAEQAQMSREFSSAEAAKQRDWEKMMSDTSYQRQRADLEAAGYNPASIGLTQGASTPSGATAAATSARGVAASSGVGSVPSSGIGNYFGQLMSSAIAYKMSEDKNFTNKMIAEMYQSNARQMNDMTNQTRKALAMLKKSTKLYNRKGDLVSEAVSEASGSGFSGMDLL